MNVKERNWQLEHTGSAYRSVRFPKDTDQTSSDPVQNTDKDAAQISGSSASEQKKSAQASEPDSSSSGKMKSSAPSDSVGQLASELSRSETKLDVMQVLSKATRALAALKMSAYSCEGKEAKKVLQMIKRMEKLIKRIQKKLKQLSKEEQIELQRKKAEKEKEAERAKQLQEELRSKRRKRRREERNYAMKELAEDGRESVNETVSALIGAGTALSGPQTAVYNASGGIDLSSVSTEGMSIDISV